MGHRRGQGILEPCRLRAASPSQRHPAGEEGEAMSKSNEERAFPIQNPHKIRHKSQVPEPVYMKAYEVYSHVFGPQPAIIEGTCRGGLEVNELIAFLYAASFPQEEWRQRVDLALSGGGV